MDTERIESLLRKAPTPRPPADLEDQLLASIPQLDSPSSPGVRPRVWVGQGSWWPRLAWGAVLLSAFVVCGLQAHRIAELKSANAELEREAAALPRLQAENELYQKLIQNQDHHEQLKLQAAEVERLKTELAGLKLKQQEMERWQAEKATIHAELDQKDPATAPDFFAESRQKAERIKCVNNLKNIGLALRIYSVDHQDLFPTDVGQITRELGTPRLLICPSDTSKQNLTNIDWTTFRPEMVSYQLFLSGDKAGEHPNRILAKCPIHSNICLGDGSVQQMTPESLRARQTMVDGRLELGSRFE